VAERWRERGYEYPPYVAYLGLFVLAAGHEGDFDPRDYYPRVWELLGEAREGTLPSFERMLELWDDLERWSVRDMNGELGLFEARIVGGKIHIGLPLAQAMLTEAERRALPSIFADAGLDPATFPSDRELRRALTIHGRSALRRSTLSALDHDSTSFVTALLDVVSDDFLEWDGEVPEDPSQPERVKEVSAGLRLCLVLDRVARSAQTTLRCRSKREFPAAGLELDAPAMTDVLTCTEALPGWSHPLASRATGTEFIVAASAWTDGLVLTDQSAGWRVTLQPSSIRVFVDGQSEQLPGLIETLDLPRRQGIYLALREDAWPALETWITADCRGWERIEIESGFPRGWIFGSVQEAATDRGIRAVDERFGFPDRRTLRFVGGMRGAVRNTFFAFAAPRVVLGGAVPGDRVECNGEILVEDEASPGWYTLPSGLPTDTRVGVEVLHDDEVIKRRSLYLISGGPWHADALVSLGGFGEPLPPGSGGILGAIVSEAPGAEMPVDPLRAPGLQRGNVRRVFFLGRKPGQVAVWPSDPIPDWEPVWAVPLARRGRAVYCGTSLDAAAVGTDPVGERDAVELWRKVLWQWRRRIKAPEEPVLRSLWLEYREAAHATSPR
jgi:hypothetical protein